MHKVLRWWAGASKVVHSRAMMRLETINLAQTLKQRWLKRTAGQTVSLTVDS
jgi:hypothetical protein